MGAWGFFMKNPRSPWRCSSSEVRLVGDWDVVVEQMLVVLGTYLFEHGLPHAPVLPDCRPELIESIRIVHRIGHFELLAILNQFPAFHDVQLRAVRRAIV